MEPDRRPTEDFAIDAWAEATRALTGRVVEEREPWIETVTEEAIRHFAYGTDDRNPLWIDPAAGKGSRWGGQIAPPAFIFAHRYPMLHGARSEAPLVAFVGGLEAAFDRPIRPGDRLNSVLRQSEFYEKRNREGRRLEFVVSEVVYGNQNGERIATARGTMILAPRLARAAALPHTIARYSQSDLAELERSWRSEFRRGADPFFFENVVADAALPGIVRGPLTIGDLVAWNAAIGPSYKAGSWGFLELAGAPGVALVNPLTGFPVKSAQGHEDFHLAAGRGMPAPFDQGVMRFAWLAPLLTNWIGDNGRLRRLSVRVRQPVLYGDLVSYGGTVTELDPARATVTVGITGRRRDGLETTSAEAEIELPRR